MLRCLFWNGDFQIHPSWCLQYYIAFSLAVGFLNVDKWDWSGDHERHSIISQTHNDKYRPPIGQSRLSWPDSGSVLVNIFTLGSVSDHIKILINKIQELELRLRTGNWKLTLSTRSLSSKLPRTIFMFCFQVPPLLQFLNWNNKSFNGETKNFPNKSSVRSGHRKFSFIIVTSLVHSHWSRNVEAWLSLVESFKVLKYFLDIAMS